MIQIDDSGSGSLLGGTGIGLYCNQSGKYHFEVIPIKYYQNFKYYKSKEYQKHVKKIVGKTFKKWKVKKSTVIQVCPSYVFDELNQWLSKNSYNWKSEKIVGELQERVQKSFFEYIISLGLPQEHLKHTRYAYGLHHLLKWVYADRGNREKLCKTCWKSFQQWGYRKIKLLESVTIDFEPLCLKCGEVITEGSTTVLKYASKLDGKIYLHPSCADHINC